MLQWAKIKMFYKTHWLFSKIAKKYSASLAYSIYFPIICTIKQK